LGKLTERPAERQRVADALGVSTFTITRWVEGKAEPRIHNLKRLPEVFPAYQGQFTELIQAELAPNIPPLPMSAVDRPEHEVGSEYFVRVLSTYATVSGPFRAWSIGQKAWVYEKLVDGIEHGGESHGRAEAGPYRSIRPAEAGAGRYRCPAWQVGSPTTHSYTQKASAD